MHTAVRSRGTDNPVSRGASGNRRGAHYIPGEMLRSEGFCKVRKKQANRDGIG